MKTPSQELMQGLRALLTAEDRRECDELRKRVRTLENRVRMLLQQRDNATGRCKELRAHVARYQAALAEARGKAPAKAKKPSAAGADLQEAWRNK